MEIKELHKKVSTKLPPEQMADVIKKTRKEHDRMLKGMFEFTDAQGGWLDFCYRFFPGESIKTIRLTHGEICDLPMGIVKHLNNTYKKVRTISGNLDEKGTRGVPMSYTKISRVRFTPIDAL